MSVPSKREGIFNLLISEGVSVLKEELKSIEELLIPPPPQPVSSQSEVIALNFKSS